MIMQEDYYHGLSKILLLLTDLNTGLLNKKAVALSADPAGKLIL